MPCWEMISDEDRELIAKVFRRAFEMDIVGECAVSTIMDICAAHLDVGLDLEKLLDAGPIEFTHDIVGIQEYINRDTGRLKGGFTPHFLKESTVPVIRDGKLFELKVRGAQRANRN